MVQFRFRESGFKSREQHGDLWLSVITFPGDLVFSSDLHGALGIYVCGTHISM